MRSCNQPTRDRVFGATALRAERGGAPRRRSMASSRADARAEPSAVRRATCIPRRNEASGAPLRSTRCATSRAIAEQAVRLGRRQRVQRRVLRPDRRSIRSSVLLDRSWVAPSVSAHGSTSASDGDGRIGPWSRVAPRRRDHGLGRRHPRHAPGRVGRGSRGDPPRGRVRRGRSDRRARRAAGDRTRVARAGRGPRPRGDDRRAPGSGRATSRPRPRRPSIEREAPGLAELMRAAGLAQTPMAALSRAVVGSLGSTLIVNLPGEPERRPGEPDGGHGSSPHAVDLLAGSTGAHPTGHARRGPDDVGSVRSRHRDDHRRQADRRAAVPRRRADRDRPRRSARGHARVRGVRRGGRAGGARRAGGRPGDPAHRDVPSRSRRHRGVRRASSVAAGARDRVGDAGRRGAPPTGTRLGIPDVAGGAPDRASDAGTSRRWPTTFARRPTGWPSMRRPMSRSPTTMRRGSPSRSPRCSDRRSGSSG